MSAGFGSNGVLSKAAKSFAALAGTRSLLCRFYGDISFFHARVASIQAQIRRYYFNGRDLLLSEICPVHTHARTQNTILRIIFFIATRRERKQGRDSTVNCYRRRTNRFFSLLDLCKASRTPGTCERRPNR